MRRASIWARGPNVECPIKSYETLGRLKESLHPAGSDRSDADVCGGGMLANAFELQGLTARELNRIESNGWCSFSVFHWPARSVLRARPVTHSLKRRLVLLCAGS